MLLMSRASPLRKARRELWLSPGCAGTLTGVGVGWLGVVNDGAAGFHTFFFFPFCL
jgi:hypothetical protein